jgi:hypothetical protein
VTVAVEYRAGASEVTQPRREFPAMPSQPTHIPQVHRAECSAGVGCAATTADEFCEINHDLLRQLPWVADKQSG